jgi:hypothetical protein
VLLLVPVEAGVLLVALGGGVSRAATVAVALAGDGARTAGRVGRLACGLVLVRCMRTRRTCVAGLRTACPAGNGLAATANGADVNRSRRLAIAP